MKIIKTIILLPMWPLIWAQLGFSLDGPCGGCRCSRACCKRAKAMVQWWRRSEKGTRCMRFIFLMILLLFSAVAVAYADEEESASVTVSATITVVTPDQTIRVDDAGLCWIGADQVDCVTQDIITPFIQER